jgi:hypothetical protein
LVAGIHVAIVRTFSLDDVKITAFSGLTHSTVLSVEEAVIVAFR